MHEWMTRTELEEMGLGIADRTPRVSSSVLFLNPRRISLGEGVRIDAFSVLSAGEGFISVGDDCHLSHSVKIYGGGGVELGVASGLSAGVCLYSQSDNFTSGHLSHPTVDPDFRKVTTAPVKIGDFCAVGANSVILPGSSMGEGSRLGALSLLSSDVLPLEVHAGVPSRKVNELPSAVFFAMKEKYFFQAKVRG